MKASHFFHSTRVTFTPSHVPSLYKSRFSCCMRYVTLRCTSLNERNYSLRHTSSKRGVTQDNTLRYPLTLHAGKPQPALYLVSPRRPRHTFTLRHSSLCLRHTSVCMTRHTEDWSHFTLNITSPFTLQAASHWPSLPLHPRYTPGRGRVH